MRSALAAADIVVTHRAQKIEDYCLLSATDNDGLAARVRDFISRGWQPFGSGSCSIIETPVIRRVYTQAMVRYADGSVAERVEQIPVEFKNSPAAGS